MGSVIGSCCGSFLASCGCGVMQSCLPKSKTSKVPYVLLMAVAVILALVLRWWGKPLLINLWITDIKFCTSKRCYGFGAILRISFSLFLFFGLHSLIAACKTNPGGMNFMLKFLGWIVMLVLVFFLPDDFYQVYAQICRVMGGVFLLLQVGVMVDSVCRWQENWMAKELQKAILGVSLFCYLGSLTALALLIHYFGGSGCGTNNAVISICLISTLLFTVLSVTNLSKHGVMPASLVTLYSWWVIFTAVTSDPSSCNPMQSENPVQLIVGILIAAFSVSWAAFSVSSTTSETGLLARSDEEAPEKRDAEDDGQPAEEDEATKKANKKKAFSVVHGAADPEDAEQAENSGFDASSELRFHLLMTVGSMYMAMLLTNWATPQDAAHKDYSLGEETYWVKVVSQWITALAYTWTFIAPLVLRGRDFD